MGVKLGSLIIEGRNTVSTRCWWSIWTDQERSVRRFEKTA
jgi:hypothetical protein